MKRRVFLGLTGAGMTALAGCPSVRQPVDRGPDLSERTDLRSRTELLADRYRTVVDVVADAGCDPDGRDSCSETLRRVADDDTLLVFPDGEYLLEDPVVLEGLDGVGIRGDGSAVLVAPPDHNGQWIDIDYGRNLLFENVTVDVTSANSSPSLKLGVDDGLAVRDVEVLGRGTHRQPVTDAGSGADGRDTPTADTVEDDSGTADGHAVGSALLPVVRSGDGSGIVERFVAKHGGRIGRYNHGNGRVGIFIGRSNVGHIRLVDCHLEEFPNNGIYASRTTGIVEVLGGVFRNNDIAQVRLGSEDSLVRDATIEIDTGAVDDPNAADDFLHPRGIRIESGPVATDGVTVRDVDVRVVDSSAGGIVVERTAGEFHIEDTRIRVDAGTPDAIIAKPPTGGVYAAPARPHRGTIRNVEVTGDATDGRSIRVFDRPGTTISGTTIEQADGDRDGIVLIGTPATITTTTVTGGRYPLVAAPADAARDDCLLTLDAVRLAGHADDRSELFAVPSQVAIDGAGRPTGSYCLPDDLTRGITIDSLTELVITQTGIEGLYGYVTGGATG